MTSRLPVFCLLLLFLIPGVAADEHDCPEEPCEADCPESDCDVPEPEEVDDETSEPDEDDNETREPDDLEEDDERDEDERDDEDDFEDDDDGFEDRDTGVRFDRNASAFRVPAGRPLQHRLVELIEFRDEDGDGAYDAGEPVLARHDLARAPDAVTGNDTKRITYLLPDGAVHLDVRSVGDATKFDIVIEAYAYQAPDTRLAVANAVRVERGVRFAEVDGQPAVLGTGSGRQAYLAWVGEVEVDGRTLPVGWSILASVDESGGDALVYWSYPQGASIVHDPVLGVTFVDVERALESRALWAAAAGTVAFLAVGAWWRRR